MVLLYSDWLTHQHRDTCSSIVGHPPLASYLAIADGESIGRIKFEMTEVCLSLLSALLNDQYLTDLSCRGCYNLVARPRKKMMINNL